MLAAIWLGLAVPAWGGEALRISGTGDALGALGMLAEAYMREHSGNTIKVLPSVGSAGAIKGVGLKRLEVGVTGRPLTSEERAQGLAEVQYAATPTVIAVGADRPLKSITRQQLADLYAGRTLAWPDGVPVRPVMRRLNESNFEKMMSLSPAVQQAVRAAEQRHGLPYASSDQEMADLLERVPGAIGVLTLGMLLSEKRAVRALAIDGVAPTPDNARLGRYPLAKRHYLVTRNDASPEVGRFVSYVRSAEGQAILRAHGYWIP